jgi:hypothetical protein
MKVTGKTKFVYDKMMVELDIPTTIDWNEYSLMSIHPESSFLNIGLDENVEGVIIEDIQQIRYCNGEYSRDIQTISYFNIFSSSSTVSIFTPKSSALLSFELPDPFSFITKYVKVFETPEAIFPPIFSIFSSQSFNLTPVKQNEAPFNSLEKLSIFSVFIIVIGRFFIKSLNLS